MKTFNVTIYRPRLERVTVQVKATTQYAADQMGFDRAEEIPDSMWENLPKTTAFYCGHVGFDSEPFIIEEGSLIPGSDKPGYKENFDDDDATG